MPAHDYTAKQALSLILLKIDEASPVLGDQIKAAINAGRDIQAEETIMPSTGRRPAKKRYYRKHIPYTDAEALRVAMTVLESHLIESRMMVNAAQEQFKQVGMASPKKLKPVSQQSTNTQDSLELDMELTDEVAEVLGIKEPKDITMETEPETVQEKKNLPDMRFISIDDNQLKTLREIFEALKPLTDFKESKYGNTH